MTDANRWMRRAACADSILDVVGLTPLVRLRRVTDGLASEILTKIEYFSPSGSVKDRVVPHIVAEAERRGDLRPGMTIIEATTGNTGIATSMVGAAKGYPVIIVMPEGMSNERKQAIRAYGAELVLTPGAESDVDLVISKVEEIKRQMGASVFEVGQFKNFDNPSAHYATTGPELWEQCGGRLDAFVASQGTGGTLSGVARYLKEQDPRVKVFAVEPAECAVLSLQGWGPHKIEGIGDGIIPEVLDLDLLDGVVQSGSDESIAMARRLAREEGIFCGISSGCNVVAAIKLARARPECKRIATMINDHGFRYFSTELCGPAKELEVPEREHPIEFDAATRRKLERLLVVK